MKPIKCACGILFRPRIKASVRCKACSPVAKKGDGKPVHLKEPVLEAVCLPDRTVIVWSNPEDYEPFS